VAGAYQFTITPGVETVMDVEAEITLRKPVQQLGLAPFSSMYWFGEGTLPKPNDFRPEVHDSDGLLMELESGNLHFRPLEHTHNRFRHCVFTLEKPRSWTLVQRDRQFISYQDKEARYHERPSVRVEPVSGMETGKLHLIEMPTIDETGDNVVLVWEPVPAPEVGKPFRFHYRLRWMRDPQPSGLFTVRATRVGTPVQKPDELLVVVDFAKPLQPVRKTGYPKWDDIKDWKPVVTLNQETAKLLHVGLEDMSMAFVDDLPAGPPVAAVLNFEARGVSGPSLMFETSPGNGPLLDALAGSGTRTFALSWAALAYTVIGNRTDFTVFREAGLDGLNFAFIHGPSAYHSKVDSLPNLDLGSLQHHGELALGLARNLASRPELAKTLGEGGPDRVYFDLLGHVLVRYSKAFALGLAVLLAGALLVLLLRSRRGGGPSFLRLLLGAVVAAAASVAVALLSAAAALVLLVPDGDVQLAGGWSSDSLVRGGLVLAAFGLALGFLRWISRRLGSGALAMGGLTLWTLLTLLVSLRLPAASSLFAWPLAAALAPAFLWLPQPATAPRKGGGLLLGLGLCALVTGVLWTPSLALLGVALGRPAVPVTGLLLGLLCFGPLVLLLAQRPGLEGVPHKTPAWAWVGVGLGLAAAVQVFTGHDSRWPGPDSLFYLADLDQGESRWLSQDRSVDAWTSRFLGDSPAAEPQPRLFGVPGQVLVAEAALLDGLPSLSVAGRPLTEDDPTEMEITVDGECDRLILFLESKGLASLSLGGKTFGFPEPWEIPGYPTAVALLYYRYRPGDLGLTVERLSTRDSLKVEAVCQNLGLPASEIRRLGDRPATLMPRPGWFSDSTLVRRTVAL
ncbi:MAG: glucan biosynthesis protein, partial [Acidobacteria bacterium]|nr:glucan biosynthesis protein [Acidobacteriota bacterium]